MHQELIFLITAPLLSFYHHYFLFTTFTLEGFSPFIVSCFNYTLSWLGLRPDSAGKEIDILCLIWHCSYQCGLIAILY